MSTSDVIGVVIVTRHGDRQGYYQDPTSYTASDTTITPLGLVQEYWSGLSLQAKYLSNSSDTHIKDITWPGVDLSQINFFADGAEGQVITDSAIAVGQGMWPANANTTTSTIQLANGTSVTSPLGGYTYIPITTIDPDNDYTFEGFDDCPNFTKRNAAIYNSTDFLAVASEASTFLSSLSSLLPNKKLAFSNMYNLFDYFNVNYIHDQAFYNSTDADTLERVRSWANVHEEYVFTDPSLDGIGNIAGQTLLDPILTAMDEIVAGTLKLAYIGVAYKPFLSLFNMTQVEDELYGMVGYASAAVYEIHNTSGTINVQFAFRNNTPEYPFDGSDFVYHNLFGSSDVNTPYDTFKSTLEPYAIRDLTTWCQRCNQTTLLGCDTVYALNTTSTELTDFEDTYASPSDTTGHFHTSPIVSGVIGALVGFILAGLFFAAAEMFRRRRAAKHAPQQYQHDDEPSNSYEMAGSSSKARDLED